MEEAQLQQQRLVYTRRLPRQSRIEEGTKEEGEERGGAAAVVVTATTVGEGRPAPSCWRLLLVALLCLEEWLQGRC